MRRVLSLFLAVCLLTAGGVIVYGVSNRWPDAEHALSLKGAAGTPVLIGVDYQYDRQGDVWNATHSRTYVFMPGCFINGTVYTYEERTGTSILGTDKVVRPRNWFYVILLIMLTSIGLLIDRFLRSNGDKA